jgi:hypothetical protein
VAVNQSINGMNSKNRNRGTECFLKTRIKERNAPQKTGVDFDVNGEFLMIGTVSRNIVGEVDFVAGVPFKAGKERLGETRGYALRESV